MRLDPVARIRRFNRAVTREAGALDTAYLGRGRPLGVARVLCAIPQGQGDIAAIRTDLNLDSGLFSRILRSLETEALITLSRNTADGRRRTATLTAKGQAEVAAYDHLNHTRAAQILSATPQTETLLAAMDLIATTLNRAHVTLRQADPDDPAALSCLAAYFALLAEKVASVTSDLFPLPDPDAQKYRPPNGTFLIAWSDNLPIGCVSLRTLEPGLGEVKRLWVAPDAKGQGLARRLMLAIEQQARTLGHTSLNLDTNAALPEAIALYHATGWAPIPAYSGFPSTHWFGKTL